MVVKRRRVVIITGVDLLSRLAASTLVFHSYMSTATRKAATSMFHLKDKRSLEESAQWDEQKTKSTS